MIVTESNTFSVKFKTNNKKLRINNLVKFNNNIIGIVNNIYYNNKVINDVDLNIINKNSKQMIEPNSFIYGEISLINNNTKEIIEIGETFDLLNENDLYNYYNVEGINIGTYEYENIPIKLNRKHINKHIGIFSNSGGGKSNLMKNITKGLHEDKDNETVIIFDTHNEYQNKNYNNINIKLNTNNTQLDELLYLLKIKENAILQRQIVKVLYNQIKEDDLTDNLIIELINQINLCIQFKIFNGRVLTNPGAMLSILNKIEEFLQEYGKIFDTKSPQILDQIKLNKINVINMNYDININTYIMYHICNELMKQKRNKENDNEYVIVFEEANSYLNKNNNNILKKNIEKYIKEMRKFKICLIIISQTINDIETNIITQLNTIISLRITNMKDIKFLENFIYDLQEIKGILNNFIIGQGLITGLCVKNSTIVNIPLFED